LLDFYAPLLEDDQIKSKCWSSFSSHSTLVYQKSWFFSRHFSSSTSLLQW